MQKEKKEKKDREAIVYTSQTAPGEKKGVTEIKMLYNFIDVIYYTDFFFNEIKYINGKNVDHEIYPVKM